MLGEGTEMLTFRFLHRATFQTIAIFLALTAAQAAEVVNLGVPNYNNIILPYFVAVDKGYYRDEGIELRLIRVNGARAVAALMSGDISTSSAPRRSQRATTASR